MKAKVFRNDATPEAMNKFFNSINVVEVIEMPASDKILVYYEEIDNEGS